jgi:hypothetical protein
MYIDIEPGVIGDEPIIGTFKETGPGVAISAVRLEFPDGWQWCEVVGWGEQGREAARLTPIEESGDGPALLLHGGSQGIRLRRQDQGAPSAQYMTTNGEAAWWNEGFLILRPEIERR